MNQQIKELVKELSDKTWTIIADEELALGEAYEAPEHRVRREEIFAELIVRECIAQCNEDVEMIKRHFGVEE